MRHRVGISATLAVVLLIASGIPAAAKGPIEVITFSDQFTDVNPCTGMEHDISVDATLRIHEFELMDPERHHFNIRLLLDATTSDGFVGRAVATEVDNGGGLFGGEEGTGMFKSLFNGVLRNPETGQKIRIHVNVTFVQVDSDPKVDTDNFVLTCLGPSI